MPNAIPTTLRDLFAHNPDAASDLADRTTNLFELTGVEKNPALTIAEVQTAFEREKAFTGATYTKLTGITALEDDIINTARTIRQSDELPPLQRLVCDPEFIACTQEDRRELMKIADEEIEKVLLQKRDYLPLAGRTDNGEEMMTSLAYARACYEEANRFATQEMSDAFQKLNDVVRNEHTQAYIDYAEQFLAPMEELTRHGLVPKDIGSANLTFSEYLACKDGKDGVLVTLKPIVTVGKLLKEGADSFMESRAKLHKMGIKTDKLFGDPRTDHEGQTLKERPKKRAHLRLVENFLDTTLEEITQNDTLLLHETKRAKAYADLAEAQQLYGSLFKESALVKPGDGFAKLSQQEDELKAVEDATTEMDNRVGFLNRLRSNIAKKTGMGEAENVLLSHREHGTLQTYSYNELIGLLHQKDSPLARLMSDDERLNMVVEFPARLQHEDNTVPGSRKDWGGSVGTHAQRRATSTSLTTPGG